MSIETFGTVRMIATRISIDDVDDLCRIHENKQFVAAYGAKRTQQQIEHMKELTIKEFYGCFTY